MAQFPLLNTGAVTQYPLEVRISSPSQVITFLDGTDQRFTLRGRPLRRWRVRLDLLDEAEMEAIQQFFLAQSGEYSKFNFPDPYSSENVANCRFGEDTFLGEYQSVDIGNTSFWVVETNG